MSSRDQACKSLQANGYSQSKSRNQEQFKPDKDHSDWFDTMDKRGRAPPGGEYDTEEEPAPRRQQRVPPPLIPSSPSEIHEGILHAAEFKSTTTRDFHSFLVNKALSQATPMQACLPCWEAFFPMSHVNGL